MYRLAACIVHSQTADCPNHDTKCTLCSGAVFPSISLRALSCKPRNDFSFPSFGMLRLQPVWHGGTKGVKNRAEFCSEQGPYLECVNSRIRKKKNRTARLCNGRKERRIASRKGTINWEDAKLRRGRMQRFNVPRHLSCLDSECLSVSSRLVMSHYLRKRTQPAGVLLSYLPPMYFGTSISALDRSTIIL